MFGFLKRFVSAAPSPREPDSSALMAALAERFGPMDEMIGHAPVPLALGGFADVAWFSAKGGTVLCSTIELTLAHDQKRNSMGRYELIIVTKERDDVAADLVSRLGRYTLEARIQPGHTMEIDGVAPAGSKLKALLYLPFGTLDLPAGPAGLLLCLGITLEELAAWRSGRQDVLMQALKDAGALPVTDWTRDSTL